MAKATRTTSWNAYKIVIEIKSIARFLHFFEFLGKGPSKWRAKAKPKLNSNNFVAKHKMEM